MNTIPGLTDIHVHMREPGATHKEDWRTGTSAALAGGITTVLAMPNTTPPITDFAAFNTALQAAQAKALCDYGQFVGAGPDNAARIAALSPRAAGLKMYLDSTFGELRLDQMPLWMSHFAAWPKDYPIAVHAEKRTLAAAILVATLYQRPLHICHVSRKEEILVIKKAKESGLPITCEVTPHHLFLTENEIPAIGVGFSEVRPVLASREDQKALWENLDVVDCFATDHAPHTPAEKSSPQQPPGFPGLETALPLLINAVKENRLTMEDILTRMYTNPQKIFKLPSQPETAVRIDLSHRWEITISNLLTRAQWTPFDGMQVYGIVQEVTLRGATVFRDGKILAQPGRGRNIR
jgi:carbamoyl-phosphate synthase/aspartate carbamoyltransferase/dihydroorotase